MWAFSVTNCLTHKKIIALYAWLCFFPCTFIVYKLGGVMMKTERLNFFARAEELASLFWNWAYADFPFQSRPFSVGCYSSCPRLLLLLQKFRLDAVYAQVKRFQRELRSFRVKKAVDLYWSFHNPWIHFFNWFNFLKLTYFFFSPLNSKTCSNTDHNLTWHKNYAKTCWMIRDQGSLPKRCQLWLKPSFSSSASAAAAVAAHH